jgi:hypothetical protein
MWGMRKYNIILVVGAAIPLIVWGIFLHFSEGQSACIVILMLLICTRISLSFVYRQAYWRRLSERESGPQEGPKAKFAKRAILFVLAALVIFGIVKAYILK